MASNFLKNWLVNSNLDSSTSLESSSLKFPRIPIETSKSEPHTTTIATYLSETHTTVTTSNDFIQPSKINTSNSVLVTIEKTNNSKIFFHMHRGGKHFVRCIICHQFPDLVQIYSKKTQVPKICQDLGAQYRTVTIDEHLKQDYHQKCIKAYKIILIFFL